MKHFFVFISIILGFTSIAQSIGEWRMHINYDNSNFGSFSSDRVISANDKSILIYDLEDNSVQTLDKAKGLSDYGVVQLDYEEKTNTFIICYENSNIDLLKGNTLINLPDIKNKLTSSSKTINNIFCKDSLAYLATDLGVVVLDLFNEEVDNTFIIGSTGNQTSVEDICILNDTIYALTIEGLKTAYLNADNLLDYSQWNHFVTAPFNISEVCAFNDSLFALADSGLYIYENNQWDLLFEDTTASAKNLTASESLYFIVENLHILEKTDTTVDTLVTPFLIDPLWCKKINGQLWYGDKKFGLFNGNNSINVSSNPFTNIGFSALSIGNKMMITSGGFNKNLDGNLNVEGGFYEFEDNRWINHNVYTTIGLDIPSEDLTRMTYNSFNGKLYIGMFKGLIEYDFNNLIIYNETNSPLQITNGSTDLIKVPGVATDSEGNVWLLNSQTNAALLVKTLDDNWISLQTGIDNTKLNLLFIDQYDQKWMTLRNEGILVLKEGDNFSQSGMQTIRLTTAANKGNLPNNNVNCIAEDKNGQIWVGTDEGIAVFSCPQEILSSSSPCVVSDRITNTLDEYTEYLFETDKVSAIEVDGANRKWIGTSAGLWLLSEDGKDEILSFNVDNSPLPSNTILDIEIQETTGEVFIITDLGIVAYFSDATEGAENFDNIKAYPNPVRPDYQGYISITGLMENAFVKITDAHGVLIDEGFALGGKYVWDGNDYNGRRAQTGIYYVFAATNLAEQKVATKIAFVK